MYRCMYLSMIVYVLLFIIIHLCVLLCAIFYVLIGFYRDGISQDTWHWSQKQRSPPLLQVTKASFGMSKPAILGCQIQQVTVGSVVISSPKNMEKYGLLMEFWSGSGASIENFHPWFYHVIHLSSSIWIRLIWLIMSISISYLFFHLYSYKIEISRYIQSWLQKSKALLGPRFPFVGPQVLASSQRHLLGSPWWGSSWAKAKYS